MITKMTKYSFILLSSMNDEFLTKLQELGLVDITRSVKAIDEKSSEMIARGEDIRKLSESLAKTDFTGDPDSVKISDRARSYDFSASGYDKAAEYHSEFINELSDLEKDHAEALGNARLSKIWGEFKSESIARLEDAGLTLNFHCVPAKKFDSAWEQQWPLQVIAQDEKKVWFVSVSRTGEEPAPFELVKKPEHDEEWYMSRASELADKIIDAKAKLQALAGCTGNLDKEYSGLATDIDKYLASATSVTAAENLITVYEGFAPEENREELCKAFDEMDFWYGAEDAVSSDNPPIALNNNRFVKNFEVLTDLYGRPQYDEFDPTPYISIFFLLFFAFCMGDLGYGLILILASFLLKKTAGFGKFSTLVLYLGIATSAIGFFFHTFFSTEMLNWAWIPESVKSVMLPSKIMGYDGTMVLSLIVGIFHLCVAMVVKAIYATRKTSFMESLGTWGWTLLIVGGVILAGIGFTGVMDASVTKWLVIALGVISAIGIFPMNNIHRSPLVNIGSGLWDTYNTATGLLGDVLSYLRLYALGLAGMYLGIAFNTLGMQCLGENPGVGSWIGCIAVVIVGHTLNIAMAALGAFVHPLRLNFLEFFKNSDYSGKGVNYNPLSNRNIN